MNKSLTFWAIIISSLLFGLGHMDSEQSIINFITGLLIGFIYHKTNSLMSAITVHFIINFFSLFFKIEYHNSIDLKLLSYHLFLIIGYVSMTT